MNEEQMIKLPQFWVIEKSHFTTKMVWYLYHIEKKRWFVYHLFDGIEEPMAESFVL